MEVQFNTGKNYLGIWSNAINNAIKMFLTGCGSRIHKEDKHKKKKLYYSVVSMYD